MLSLIKKAFRVCEKSNLREAYLFICIEHFQSSYHINDINDMTEKNLQFFFLNLGNRKAERIYNAYKNGYKLIN